MNQKTRLIFLFGHFYTLELRKGPKLPVLKKI